MTDTHGYPPHKSPSTAAAAARRAAAVQSHHEQHEALLPGTHALNKSTLEMQPYRSGWLVRIREQNGSTKRQTFKADERDNAFQLFLTWLDELRTANTPKPTGDKW
jgi:hypothetical protein